MSRPAKWFSTLLLGPMGLLVVTGSIGPPPTTPAGAVSSRSPLGSGPAVRFIDTPHRPGAASKAARGSPALGPTGPPVLITVASVGIRDSVQPAVPVDGVLEPPPHQVVWDAQTPIPGHLGGALVVGHDEWDGPSDFWNLDQVRVGAIIAVAFAGGSVASFIVTATRSELKTDAQDDVSIWRPDPDRRELIVVTCDRYSPVVAGHHLNNFVVYATMRR